MGDIEKQNEQLMNDNEQPCKEKMFYKILDKIGATPNTLIIQNVAIKKGNSLKELYVIGNSLENYVSEESAKNNLKPNEQLYKLDIYRVE